MIRVDALSKSFHSGSYQLRILDGLDLSLDKGRTLAVVGASGSGKSTFLHLVGGMEKADSGAIQVAGYRVDKLEGSELARYRNLNVGFVFQLHHLLAEFSALENVMFPLLLRESVHGGGEPDSESGRPRLVFREAEKEAGRWLDEVGLGDRMQHKPSELSGGEQQRVAVARALVTRPKVLLADEPTGDLDPTTSEAIHQLILGINQRHGITSIIVTHDPELASLCDETKVLESGRLIPKQL